MIILYICMSAMLFLTGCQPHVRQEEAEQLTLGTVQKRISVGMSQPDVASALGMPNIVTKDAHGKEAWIYDKMATEVSYSRDQGGVWLILGGIGSQHTTMRTGQRTLTVVIKFNDQGHVDDLTYHASQF